MISCIDSVNYTDYSNICISLYIYLQEKNYTGHKVCPMKAICICFHTLRISSDQSVADPDLRGEKPGSGSKQKNVLDILTLFQLWSIDIEEKVNSYRFKMDFVYRLY